MRRGRRVAFALLVVAAAVGGGLIAAGNYVAGQVESRVAALPGVSAESVRPGLLGVELGGVRVRRDGHEARAASVSVRPSLSTLVAGGLVLGRVTVDSPVIELAEEDEAGAGDDAAGATAQPASTDSAETVKPGDGAADGGTAPGPRLRLRRLVVRDGVVRVPAEGEHPPLRLEDVRFEVADLDWPTPVGRSPFSLQATFEGGGRSRLGLRGWVADSGGRARVTITAERLPLVRLAPWFRDVGTTAPVSDGELGLDATVEVEGERYVASGTLQLGGVEFEADRGEFLGVSADIVARVFRVPENRVELPFEVSGSTDREGNWRAQLLRAAFRDAGARLADGGEARALDRARERLDAGDVEGAVETLGDAKEQAGQE